MLLGQILETLCTLYKAQFWTIVHETVSECQSSKYLGQVQNWVMLGQKLGR